jgi:hypothetical protein
VGIEGWGWTGARLRACAPCSYSVELGLLERAVLPNTLNHFAKPPLFHWRLEGAYHRRLLFERADRRLSRAVPLCLRGVSFYFRAQG